MQPPEQRIYVTSAAGVAKFTATVALAAIFVDASIGHGLTWENDPYWTYWVTKTFLIATIFGLGTAWFGIGIARGAVITAIHTAFARARRTRPLRGTVRSRVRRASHDGRLTGEKPPGRRCSDLRR